ncbi:MAG: hypothetical protein H8D45_02235 [Bacteroidetes bacterium]|nr:hypothetical protein [Bacteroidota bacterium]
MTKLKSCNLGKSLSLLLALFIVVLPLLAQQADNPIYDAERQAMLDVDKTLWLAIGCLIGFVGVAVGYLIEPKPPQSALLGKSPEYVAVYTDAYQKKAKSIQGTQALYGCIANTVAWVAVYVLLIAAAESTGSIY